MKASHNTEEALVQRPYSVELFFERTPTLDAHAILAKMQADCGHVELAEAESESGTLVFLHKEHPVHVQEGDVPAQCVLMTSAHPCSGQDDYLPVYQQSWKWPDVQDCVERCSAILL